MLSLQPCYITNRHAFWLCFPTQERVLLDSFCSDRLYSFPENLVWFPSISVCSLRLYSPRSSLFALLPAVFGGDPVGLVQTLLQGSLPSIYNRRWLRFGSGRPAGFPNRDTQSRTWTVPSRTHSETKRWSRYIIFAFLFIHLELSIYPLVLSPGIMNNLPQLKETTWGATEEGGRETEWGELKWSRIDKKKQERM